MNIIVPMHAKTTPIHSGHISIINYAKKFGNPVVYIHQRPNKKFKQNEIKNQISSIEKLGVNVYIMSEFKINPDKLSEAKYKAKIIVEQYRDNLILERYIKMATNHITYFFIGNQEIPKKYRGNIIVYGPEVFHFFIKSISKIAGIKKCYIFKKIVKSEETKIRYQTMISRISEESRQQLPKIKTILDKYKCYFKNGKNLELVEKLNKIYKNKIWSIYDITLFEGKMIEGKLEIVGIEFSSQDGSGGSVLLEEANYYA